MNIITDKVQRLGEHCNNIVTTLMFVEYAMIIVNSGHIIHGKVRVTIWRVG